MTSKTANKTNETLTFTSVAREADKLAAEKIRSLIASSLEVSFVSLIK